MVGPGGCGRVSYSRLDVVLDGHLARAVDALVSEGTEAGRLDAHVVAGLRVVLLRHLDPVEGTQRERLTLGDLRQEPPGEVDPLRGVGDRGRRVLDDVGEREPRLVEVVA